MESFNRRNDIMSFMFLQGLSVSFVEKGLEESRGEQGAAGRVGPQVVPTGLPTDRTWGRKKDITVGPSFSV